MRGNTIEDRPALLRRRVAMTLGGAALAMPLLAPLVIPLQAAEAATTPAAPAAPASQSAPAPENPTAAVGAKVDGEIRRIDKDAAKVTIRHGEIRHLDMPPMTMVFHARNAAMLDQVKVGDKVRFAVVHEGGKYVVTEIKAAQ